MSPVSYDGECFLQEGFKSDSERMMKDLKKNDAGCQVFIFLSVDSFDFVMVESHATTCTFKIRWEFLCTSCVPDNIF